MRHLNPFHPFRPFRPLQGLDVAGDSESYGTATLFEQDASILGWT